MMCLLCCILVSAQENLQRSAKTSEMKKTFTTLTELPITSVKNQYRSGTCWDYATLGFFESEILRKTGKTYDLCEMFVVNKDYMDCATHYVRMHGYSQISEGSLCTRESRTFSQRVAEFLPESCRLSPGQGRTVFWPVLIPC